LSCNNCNETLKKFRGCNDSPVQPYLVDGKPLDRCPAKIIPIEVKEYIKYYEYYKKGHLLFSGGLMRQPMKILQIFEIFETAEFEAAKNRREELNSL